MMTLDEHLRIAIKKRREELKGEISTSDLKPLVQRHKLGQEFAFKFVENEIRIWRRNQNGHK